MRIGDNQLVYRPSCQGINQSITNTRHISSSVMPRINCHEEGDAALKSDWNELNMQEYYEHLPASIEVQVIVKDKS